MKLIDVHTHDGSWKHTDPKKYDYLGETMKEFIADLDRDKVSLCFISSVTALIRDMERGNRITYRDAEKDPRIFAYTYWDPTRPRQSLAEAKKYRNHPKFIGFKSRPAFHNCLITHPGYKTMIRLAGEWKKPILLHCWPLADAGALAHAASRSKATFIMVHACGDQFREAVRTIKPFRNVVVEPVTSIRYPGKIRAILNIVGSKRLLFGSDYGLLGRPRILRTYREARLSAAEARAVFYENAERIFGITAK